MITFQQQETTEIRNRIRAAWVTYHTYRQELTSKTTCSNMICYASGTWTPTQEHERTIQSTQRKMLRFIIQMKRRYKKIVKQKDKTKEEKYTNDMRYTGDKSEDGQSSNSHKDQDSDVSFENDIEEEMGTTEIEEEDWTEYIKRSTNDAKEKMEKCGGDSMPEQDAQNSEMETGAETSNITKWGRWLMKAAEWEPRTQLKIQDQQSDWETKKKMGRWLQRMPQTRLKTRQKTYFTEGSSQINKTWITHSKKTAEYVLYSEKRHN